MHKMKKMLRNAFLNHATIRRGRLPTVLIFGPGISTAKKQAVRISIAISKTDPGEYSRQHPLFLHGKLHSEWMTPTASESDSQRWHAGLQQEIGMAEVSSRQNSSTPSEGLCRYSTNKEKRGKN